jgi:hypothetical protein
MSYVSLGMHVTLWVGLGHGTFSTLILRGSPHFLNPKDQHLCSNSGKTPRPHMLGPKTHLKSGYKFKANVQCTALCIGSNFIYICNQTGKFLRVLRLDFSVSSRALQKLVLLNSLKLYCRSLKLFANRLTQKHLPPYNSTRMTTTRKFSLAGKKLMLQFHLYLFLLPFIYSSPW